MATITAERARPSVRGRRQIDARARAWRLSVAVLLCGLALVVGGLSLRLAAIVAATPPVSRLVEAPPRAPFGVSVPAAVSAWAETLASRIGDPALAAARLSRCGTDRAASERCIAVIDDALAAAPASGELWLARAQMLAATVNLGAPFAEALTRSWDAAPREGWIAATRVVLAIRFLPLLPAEAQVSVIRDLDVVIGDPVLSAPLRAAFAAEPAFRARTIPLIDRVADVSKKEAFVWILRQAMPATGQ